MLLLPARGVISLCHGPSADPDGRCTDFVTVFELSVVQALASVRLCRLALLASLVFAVALVLCPSLGRHEELLSVLDKGYVALSCWL